MKKQSGLLRRLTALALALCMLVALTSEIFAADIVASGYCGGEGDGTNLTWKLDSEGTLTISGKGKMEYGVQHGWDSYSVKKLIVESGVESITADAFADKKMLQSVVLNEGLKSIDARAFFNCTNLTEITLPSTLCSLGGNSGPVDGQAFYNTGIRSICIPGKLTELTNYANFGGCKNLETVYFEEGVEEINMGSFRECPNLKEINFPTSLKVIERNSFQDCKSLKRVFIPENVSEIWVDSFGNCTGLENLYFYGDAPVMQDWQYSSVGGFNAVFNYLEGKSGWTDSQFYDSAAGTWNGYPLKTWDIKTGPVNVNVVVPTGKYCIHVVDEFGAPISGAAVTWQSDTATTNDDGNVFFKCLTAGTPVLRVSKPGYLSWTNEGTNWTKNSISFEQVILYPESYGGLKLKTAKIGKCDLLTQTKVLNLRNDGNLIGDLNWGYFDLTCAATDTSDVMGYTLYQKNKIIDSSLDGNFEKLDVRKFVKGGGCFIRVTSKTGKAIDTDINLQFAENSVNENTEIMLKSSALSLKISDDIPYLGGTTLKFDLPLQAPVVFSCTEDKIQLGVNLKLNDKESKEKQTKEYIEKIKELQKIGKLKNNKWPLKRNITQLKKYVQKNNKVDFFKDKMDFTFCGYLEGDVGSKTISGYFLIIGESKLINIEHNFMMWFVPVTFQTNLNFYFEAGGGGSYCFDTKMWDLNIVFNPTFTLEGFLGAGCSKLAGLGAYGCAELETKVNIIGTNSGLQSADLTGELAIKGYIGWVEAKRVFAHQTWNLYTANSVKSHSLRSGAAWDAAPEASAYAPSDLSYLAEESDWAPAAVRTYAARAAQARTKYHPLLENTYRNAQPVMISDGSALYAAFVRANETTGKRYVALTKFDGTSWSAPAAVDASAILDDAPQLCTDADGNLWLAYARTTQDPGNSLVTYAEHQNIVVGTVDKTTLAFTEQKVYQSDDYMRLPTLSCVNGTPVLAWAESAVTSEESVVNPTASAVYTAEYRGGAWLDARKAADAAAVSSLCIGAQNGTPAVAYTADGKLHCGSRLLAENVTGRAVYGKLPGAAGESFIWNADGALHDEAGNTVPVEGLGRDFVIVGDSIYFNQSNGASANLAALHYDAVNDHWSAPILLIGDEQYLENLNAAELNGKTYALGMHTTVTITADDVDDTKDLVWTQILPVSDLKLSDVSFDADALVPGETLPVTFTVTNSGDHTVSSLTLTADGVSTAQDCQLLPGESGEFTVNITCPSEKQIVTFEVQEPGQDDYTPEDNTAACTVGSADAEVELALLQIGSRKFLQAVVVNRGLEPASGSVLFAGPDGQTLAERTFQNLTYGGTVIAEYEPDSFAALYGEDVTATVRLQQDEPNMLNNTDSVPVLLTSTEILSAQRTGTAVTAEIACMQDGARAICAFYAADGRLLRTVIQPLESGKINSLTFQIDSNAAQAKLFVLDAKNAPAAPARSIPLNS